MAFPKNKLIATTWLTNGVHGSLKCFYAKVKNGLWLKDNLVSIVVFIVLIGKTVICKRKIISHAFMLVHYLR